MYIELLEQLALSLLFGAIIGFEREYRSKAAGFRTITLITLGSTLFTMLSFKLGTPFSHDRMAANIVMGIGFIGAGAIFKDGINVSGLTTASSIWVSAAIGIAIGLGEYVLASATLVLAITILSLFEKIQDWIERFHQVRTYKLLLPLDYKQAKEEIENRLKELQLKNQLKKSIRAREEITFFYLVSGPADKLDLFSEFLVDSRTIKAFDE